MTILTIRKAYSWFKANWYLPAIAVVVIALLIFMPTSAKSLIDMVKKRREIHRKEVEALEDAHENEIIEREMALDRFHTSMEIIEEQFEENKHALDKKKKKEIEKIIKNSDPDDLTKRISEATGFVIVFPE